MILKDKVTKAVNTAQAKAGVKQELDVAFYLRRAFKDHEQVFVFNDLKFSYNQETAQIDHLVFYPYGFVLIESKSITGEVKVNAQEEWTRSYNDKWQGMPSPIKQVELQQRLFREMLFENKAEMLGKVLGLRQEGFGGRCWDNVCAVSSNAIIDRDSMPSKVSKQLVKSEFLVEKLNSIMKLRNAVLSVINILDSRPKFTPSEMAGISQFILSQGVVEQSIKKITPKLDSPKSINITADKAVPAADTLVLKNDAVWHAPTDKKEPTLVAEPAVKALQLTCKKCGLGPKLTPSYGKYGYYTACDNCSTNTSMKQPCPSCKSKKTKVSKKRESYTLNCQECEVSIGLAV